MADSLTSKIQILFQAAFVNTLTDGSIVDVQPNETISLDLTDGTAAGKADKLWFSKGRTLTSGNSETIDLYDFGSIDLGAGAGKDPLGGSLALADITGFLIYNRTASAGSLYFGPNNESTGWNSPFADFELAALDNVLQRVFPGGFAAFGSPTDPAYAIADSTNHTIAVVASGGNVTYDIYVLGRSA